MQQTVSETSKPPVLPQEGQSALKDKGLETSQPQLLPQESESALKEKELVAQLAQLKILVQSSISKESAMSVINTYASLANSGNLSTSELSNGISNEMLTKLKEIRDLYDQGIKDKPGKETAGLLKLLAQPTIKCHELVLLGKDLNAKLGEWRAILIPKSNKFDNLQFIQDQEEIVTTINAINLTCLALQKARDDKNGISPSKDSSADSYSSTAIGTMYHSSRINHVAIQGDKITAQLKLLQPSTSEAEFVKDSCCVIS